jgi:alpha-methylacyl-CoA racemase
MNTRSPDRRDAWPDRADARDTDALRGIRVLDLSQNAPGPMTSLLLADFGADVIHVAPPAAALAANGYLSVVADNPFMRARFSPVDALMRNKRSVSLDLKQDADRSVCAALAGAADVLIEEMRPGKAAKLGLDYATLSAVNPALVYCSITGYGQTGPRANTAGHDIAYVAASGLLDLLRDRNGRPVPPLNLAADYVGGLTAAFSILAALNARQRDGRGQHVDVGLTDAAAYSAVDLMSMVLGRGLTPQPLRELFGGDAPFYTTYRCADGRDVAVGALERRFAANLCTGLGRPDVLAALEDRSRWDEASAALAAAFATRTRDEWLAILGDECCVSPVVEAAELHADPQSIARGRVVDVGGVRQIGVGPKLSSTPGRIAGAPTAPGAHTEEILRHVRAASNVRG